MSKEKSTDKPFYKKWWFIAIVAIFILGLGGALSDEETQEEDTDLNQEVDSETNENDSTDDNPSTEDEEETNDSETVQYDGTFKFTGEAVTGIENDELIIDNSVEKTEDGGSYTDITITENMEDVQGNVLTPGTYEFQFIEFPETQGQGAWYVYLNDTRISGNPNASDAGERYEFKEGDILSIDYWSVATFYKIAE